MEFFLQLMLTGIALGSGYALSGLGFVLIYKATGVFNFSHGHLSFTCFKFSLDFRHGGLSPRLC